jgi:hypothetical protein
MQGASVLATALSFFIYASTVLADAPPNYADKSFLRELDTDNDRDTHNRRELKSILGDIIPSPREMIEIGIVLMIGLFIYKKYKEGGFR